ncbi:hypothetical protein GCG21_13655 [Pseudactinotalea sp. HY160]|uniref:hypothetical protein n=1 Tax=Pseudactinotalea sp. HY160 TaxID=2654490 RepID=UPI00128DCA3B|nr:hypothetical protein [Pseudactinotalea sp. HY160]MPV51032.1 hypothetical protein [Pseudactinotalea sp. HY160]
MKKRNPTTLALVGVLAFGGLAGTGATIDGLRKAQHEQQVTAEADAVTAISQTRASGRESMAADAQDWIEEQIAEATKARDEAITPAEKTLAETKGKVADKETRTKLADAIASAEKQSTIPGIESATTKVIAAEKKVAESHEAWKKAEKERKEAEAAAKRKAEQEAAARASASAYSPASRSASSGSSSQSGTSNNSKSSAGKSSAGKSNSGKSSGGKSNSGSSKPKAPSGGYKSRIAGILSTYGCGGAGISIDDPRMGKGANGTADWYNNTVLIRSGLTGRLNYVVAHECVHLKQYRIYGGNLDALQADMNRIYGGTGFSGLEQNADCVTRRWGISQYHYTTSCGGARGKAAAAIAGGSKP